MLCYTNTTCLSLLRGADPHAIASVFQCFVAAQCLTHDILPDAEINSNVFDFIIIGAGSAGSVVANRLSEVEDWKILLVEAGSDPPISSDIPGLQTLMYGTKSDWQYTTVNDGVTSQGLKNGSVNWIKGKMLGGSSSINAMVYVPGNDQDYQNWYDAGNKEWSVDHVRRCFKKAEGLQNKAMLDDPNISESYGHEGPLNINKFNSTYRYYLENIIESWDDMGFKKVPDLKVANFMGSGNIMATASSGVRQSTNKAYLQPIKNRPNLIILKNTLVTRILINENATAYGVEVEKDCQKLTYYSSREVILSAGSVSSPQLLMLSGVGPHEHLKAKNISCIVDSPMVGQNLQDHALVPITVFGDKPVELTTAATLRNVEEYLVKREGIFAQSSLVSDAAVFFSTIDNASYPNIQNHVTIFNNNNTLIKGNLDSIFRYNASVVDSIVKRNENKALYLFVCVLLHPYSRGNISLSSKNPKDKPLIYANYFDDTRDLDIAVKGIKMATQILNTPYFKSINGFLGRMDVPQCNILELDSEEYWKCICLNLVISIFHPVGTCQMGSDLSTSVVDSRLRVHGVANVRVIDASVMPTTTSGNTNGPCIMIGERGSEMIKEDYNKT